ncbi:hypothetical protein F7725_011882 [Dissostichus mawsoni]|uniref:Uncharacterized protein n=1 Tax=Dissostichus mawsoni TaxID=36200 RepID=A0A7J5ZC25_DISMA|nr:hypothetical protein F7725_011882 [Dissostichus mawsoni]
MPTGIIYRQLPHPSPPRERGATRSMGPAAGLRGPPLTGGNVAVRAAVVALAWSAVHNVLDMLYYQVDGDCRRMRKREMTSAREPCVWIRVDKQLHLEQISDLLRVEHEDALEQHHISRVHRDELLFPGTTQTWKRFPHGQHLVEAVLAEDGHLPLVMVDLVLAQQLHDLLTY